MGCQWFGMAKELMQVQMFARSIRRSSEVLAEHGLDLYALLMSDDSNTFNNLINSFVSIASIQVVYCLHVYHNMHTLTKFYLGLGLTISSLLVCV